MSENAEVSTVLVLRTCSAAMTSHGGFKWPDSGPVSAPDWKPTAECGNGLHGFLWGVGDGSLADWDGEAKWLVCRVAADTVIDLGGKVKFPSAEVIHCGDRKSATEYIAANGAEGRAIVRGTSTSGVGGASTSGDWGTSTSGYRGTSTSGDGGTSTSGVGGTSTSGDWGTSTSGYRGTSTSGVGGVIAILYWNGKRYKTKVAHVKDEGGDGELLPNVPYRLNAKGEFEVAAR